MIACKITFVFIILCAISIRTHAKPTKDIFEKITGIVKTGAEHVHDKVLDTAHNVHEFFHPHHHHPGGHGHHSSGPYTTSSQNHGYPTGEGQFDTFHSTGQGPYSGQGYPKYPTNQGQDIFKPGYQTGQGSHKPNSQTGQESSFPEYTNSNPKYPNVESTFTGSSGQDIFKPGYQTGQGSHKPNSQTGHESSFPEYINSNSKYPKGESPLPGSSTGQGSYDKYPTGGGSNHPPYSTGERPSFPNTPTKGGTSVYNPESVGVGEDLSENDNPTYNLDMRNSQAEITSNSSQSTTETLDPGFRSLLAFKGCPEGQRKDHSGKCRAIS